MRKKDHQHLDSAYLGYTSRGIHQIIDIAVKWLGAGHRITHHSLSILDFFEILQGVESRKIALFHILIDAKIIDGEALLKKAKELEW